MHSIMLAYYLGKRQDNPKTTFFDQLICTVDDSRYSHLEYVRDYNSITGRALCYSASPRDGGVRSKVISLSAESWELYSVSSPVSDDQMLAWFFLHQGKKYDWFGAFATKLPVISQSRRRWFCSEAIADAMGLPQPRDHTPKSIYRHLLPASTRIPV